VTGSSLRVLVLGGTGFIGPHFVQAALDRGHQVATFTRGLAGGPVPDGVERLAGDRVADLRSITDRTWDAVIDLATLVPSWVRRLGEALHGRVGHYTFISTHYVYRALEPGETATEDTPVRDYSGARDPFELESSADAGDHYGALKVLCEREAELWFPNRVAIQRPCYIVGPGDPQPFLAYLPLRIARGGEMLMPGEPTNEVQFVDVRDLADFAIREAETGGTGVFNMAGPTDRTSIGDLLAAAGVVAGMAPDVVWVPSGWLAARDAAYWRKPLFWSPDGMSAWVTPTSSARALARGGSFRPILESLTMCFEDARSLPRGIDEPQELYVTDADGRLAAERVEWTAYLRREGETIDDWRAALRTSERVGG
jgi:2'-hydroxyisoflavone reductase